MSGSTPEHHTWPASVSGGVDRRAFLRFAGAVGAGIGFASAADVLSPWVAEAAVRRWSDPATWGGRVPGPGRQAVVRGTVLLDVDARVKGVVVRRGAALIFPPGTDRTLTSTANVVLHGTLRMRPSGPRIVHRLLFAGIDEGRFRGGGEDVLASDVGLWVRPRGMLDLVGSPKRAWTRAEGSLASGATTIQLQHAPDGWRVGDEVAVVPTASGDFTGFEVRRLAAVNHATRSVRLSEALDLDHPRAVLPGGRVMTAEILNLTRNVRIEGRPGGRAHSHIMSERRQRIRHVGLRHMGPRRAGGLEPVSGRYALHFHLGNDGPEGTLVEGVVGRDMGNRVFVPHTSHGITFRRCIAYNVAETPFWWDRLKAGREDDGNVQAEDFALTHDCVWDRCVAANVFAVRGGSSESVEGFLHNFGMRNAALGCVAVGVRAPNLATGYFWPAQVQELGDNAVWRHEDCVAHNIEREGFTVWQISSDVHVVDRPIVYRTPVGIEHGAYRNVYHYRDGICHETSTAALELVASGGTDQAGGVEQRWVRMRFDAAGGDNAIFIRMHSLAGARPGILQECVLTGHGQAAIRIDEETSNQFSRGGSYDFVRCLVGDRDLEPSDIDVVDLHVTSVIRVQRRGGSAFRVTTAGIEPIPAFV
jgi:hypothetical protein